MIGAYRPGRAPSREPREPASGRLRDIAKHSVYLQNIVCSIMKLRSGQRTNDCRRHLRCRPALPVRPARLPTHVHACPVSCVQRPAHAAALLAHILAATAAISPAWRSLALSLPRSQAAAARSSDSCRSCLARLALPYVRASAASGLPPVPLPAGRAVPVSLAVDVVGPHALF